MNRQALQVSILLAAFCAAGASAAAGLAPPEVELVRPRPGEVLTAGSEAVVEWAPAGELAEGIEEWEAFLSLNDGAFYALRVTPHLEASLRRFTFRVPDVPTEEARILLRFGDEVHEVGVEMPRRFTIRPSLLPPPLPRHLAPAPGEAARPGEHGVVAWVEGSRQGTGVVQVESQGPAGLRPAFTPHIPGILALAPPRSPQASAMPARLALLAEEPPPKRPPPVLAAPAPSPILLLGCRLNE